MVGDCLPVLVCLSVNRTGDQHAEAARVTQEVPALPHSIALTGLGFGSYTNGSTERLVSQLGHRLGVALFLDVHLLTSILPIANSVLQALKGQALSNASRNKGDQLAGAVVWDDG